jgi:hypothetical protein
VICAGSIEPSTRTCAFTSRVVQPPPPPTPSSCELVAPQVVAAHGPRVVRGPAGERIEHAVRRAGLGGKAGGQAHVPPVAKREHPRVPRRVLEIHVELAVLAALGGGHPRAGGRDERIEDQGEAHAVVRAARPDAPHGTAGAALRDAADHGLRRDGDTRAAGAAGEAIAAWQGVVTRRLEDRQRREDRGRGECACC